VGLAIFCGRENQNNLDAGCIRNNSKTLSGHHAGIPAGRLGKACNIIFIIQTRIGAAAPQECKREAPSFAAACAQNTITPRIAQTYVCSCFRAYPDAKFLRVS
jgi:hypothetical protein